MSSTKVSKILIARGLEANVPTGWEIGRLYLATDTGHIFFGQGASLPLGQVGATGGSGTTPDAQAKFAEMFS
jgi:hypothetical protein